MVIPVYKTPDEQEIVSILQTLNLLKTWDIKLIGPESLDYNDYQMIGFKDHQIIKMDDSNFNSIASYNQLLCSKKFYQPFIEYEFLLIVQTDAWILRDELQIWCVKAFDYIGAPWIFRPEQTKKKVLVDLYPLMKNQVGNGGVSLRKIQTHIKYSWLAKCIYAIIRKNEDFVWLLVSKIPFVQFRKPKWKEALEFCVEMNPKESMKILNDNLPFSLHAWKRYGAEYWKNRLGI